MIHTVSAERNFEPNMLISEIKDCVAVSASVTCPSDQVKVSATLEAMKVPMEMAMGTIRFSKGKLTTAEEIDKVVSVVSEIVKKLMRV
jgi:cysteine desulfurase